MSKVVLYRKYRPQSFEEVLGQDHIVPILKNAVKTGRISHAYLFSGSRGTGKTSLARILAKEAGCSDVDLIEIDAASSRGVDEIRALREAVRFSPMQGQVKVYIIDEAHMLTKEAFNALLKTLEEPPSHAIFILATTEIHKILPTILSRCQRFDFRKVRMEELIRRLGFIIRSENKDVDREVVELVAARSEGCIRDAESLLEQIFSMGDKKITIEQALLVIPYSDFHYIFEFATFLKNRQSQEAVDFINRIMFEGVDLERFADDIIEGLRKIMILKLNGKLSEYSFDLQKDQEMKLLELSQSIDIQRLVFMIEVFLKKKGEFYLSPIVQLPLELAVIDICAQGKK